MTQPTRQTPASRAYLDLQNRARREGRGTQELLTLYVVERWLARLSSSPYADRFVLKGGMLLAGWAHIMRRVPHRCRDGLHVPPSGYRGARYSTGAQAVVHAALVRPRRIASLVLGAPTFPPDVGVSRHRCARCARCAVPRVVWLRPLPVGLRVVFTSRCLGSQLSPPVHPANRHRRCGMHPQHDGGMPLRAHPAEVPYTAAQASLTRWLESQLRAWKPFGRGIRPGLLYPTPRRLSWPLMSLT